MIIDIVVLCCVRVDILGLVLFLFFQFYNYFPGKLGTGVAEDDSQTCSFLDVVSIEFDKGIKLKPLV